MQQLLFETKSVNFREFVVGNRSLIELPSWEVVSQDAGLTNGGIFVWRFRPGAYYAGPIREIISSPDGQDGMVVVHWVALAVTLPDGRESWSRVARRARSFRPRTPITTGWNDREQIDIGPVTLFRAGTQLAPCIPVDAEGYPPVVQRLLLDCEEIGWYPGRFEVAIRQLYELVREKAVKLAIEQSVELLRLKLHERGGFDPAAIESFREERRKSSPLLARVKEPVERLGITELDALALFDIVHQRWVPSREGPGSHFEAFARGLHHPLFAGPFLMAYVVVSTEPSAHGDAIQSAILREGTAVGLLTLENAA